MPFKEWVVIPFQCKIINPHKASGGTPFPPLAPNTHHSARAITHHPQGPGFDYGFDDIMSHVLLRHLHWTPIIVFVKNVVVLCIEKAWNIIETGCHWKIAWCSDLLFSAQDLISDLSTARQWLKHRWSVYARFVSRLRMQNKRGATVNRSICRFRSLFNLVGLLWLLLQYLLC